jgi:hypothetical protein
MSKPVRTTIVFGLVSGTAMYPAVMLLMPALGWSAAVKLTLWGILALYALLLARWGRSGTLGILFPLTLLLGAALWPPAHAGFFLMALGVLSWIRSGICFTGTPLRALIAELVTVVGGAALVAFQVPSSTVGWAVGIWLFALVQSLYFFIIPGRDSRDVHTSADPFEEARRELEKVLETTL